MRVTCTSGNARNKIRGSRVTIRLDSGEIVDQFEVPARYGESYCKKHPGGEYGKRYYAAVDQALRAEDAIARER